MVVAIDNQAAGGLISSANIQLQQKLVSLSRYLVSLVIIVALFTLAGWIFDIGFLKRPLPRLVAMNPLSATTFLIAGISFYLLSSPGKRGFSAMIGYFLSGLIILAGILRLSDVIFHTNTGVDLLIFSGKLERDASGNFYSRMAPITAFNFILTGISFLLMRRSFTEHSSPGHIFSVITALLGILAILGYVYRVEAFYGILTYIPMAIHSAICFLALSLSTLFANPGRGVMKEFTTRYTGSMIAKSLVPVAIAIPAILGYLRLLGYWRGFFSTEFGVTILVTSIMIVFLLFIWYTVTQLNRRDQMKGEAEIALQKMQQQVDALFDTAPDATVIVNDKGFITLVNKQTEKLFGYQRAELVGRPVEILVPAELRNKHLGHVRSYSQEPRARAMGRGMELQAVKKSGERFPVEISLSPLQTDEGMQVSASIRDITDRKKLEQKFRSLLDSAPDATVIVNEKGFIEMVNRQVEVIFGYTRQELVGQTVEMLIPEELRNGHLRHVAKYVEEPRVRSMGAGMELQAVRKNRTRFPVEISLSPLQTEEGMLVSASIRDITERKQSEEKLRQFNEDLEKLVRERTLKIAENEAKYRTLIEEAVDAIAVFSLQDQKYVTVNKKMMELTGYSKEEIFSMSILDMLIPEDIENNPPQYELLFSGKTAYNERFLKRKDGTVISIESNAKLLPDGYCLAFLRDITERKRSQAEILRMNEELRRLSAHLQDVREEERVHIAREIHDELGQQLTAIKMDIATINKRLNIDDNEIKERNINVLKMLDRAVQTVRRIASELRPSVLDDLGLITALEWQLQEFVNRSGIKVQYDNIESDIHVDKTGSVAIFRIFQESLTNISRHAEATEVKVQLSVENARLVLTIADNGKGFDKEAMQNKRTLGLLGMKERASMIDGSYEINSQPGKGTTIIVRVPIMRDIAHNQ